MRTTNPGFMQWLAVSCASSLLTYTDSLVVFQLVQSAIGFLFAVCFVAYTDLHRPYMLVPQPPGLAKTLVGGNDGTE
jgi:hypothetical protein